MNADATSSPPGQPGRVVPCRSQLRHDGVVRSRPLRVFVSYSRVDFAFAEAVVAALRRHEDIDPWMDLQRLRPGVNWSAAITESLDRADALVLVASPSSLASGPVADELAHAFDRHLPVYVGVVAAVRLDGMFDGKLAACPGLDLRTRFRQRAEELGRTVAGATTSARPRPRWPRWRVPGPVAGVAALALTATLALLTAGVQSPRASLVYPVLAVAAAVPVVVSTVGLLLRRCTLRSLLTSLGGPVLFGGCTVVFGLPVAPVLPVAMLAAPAVSVPVLLFSTSVRLRLPSGHDLDVDRFVTEMVTWLWSAVRTSDDVDWATLPLTPDFATRWAPFRRRLAELPHSGSLPAVAITAAPADDQVARIVTGACTDAGLTVTDGPARWTLALVGAHTDMAALAALIGQADTQVICVLVDSIRAETFEEFRRHQWMDFRAHRPEHLFSLLSALRMPERPSDGHIYLTPIDPEQFRAPIGVHAFVNGTRDFVSTVGGAALGFLATSPLHTGDLVQAALSGLLLGAVVTLHDRTTKRRLTAPGFGLAAVVVSVLAGIWIAWWLSEGWVSWTRPLPALGLAAIMLGLPLYLAGMTWYLGRTWLPARNTPLRGGHRSVGAGWFTALTPLLFGAGFAFAMRLSGY